MAIFLAVLIPLIGLWALAIMWDVRNHKGEDNATQEH